MEDAFFCKEQNPYGDDLSLNHWSPDSKPLSLAEKRDLIKRIRSGRVSDGFRKSYRAYVHKEQEILKAKKLRGKSLSFSAINKDSLKDPFAHQTDIYLYARSQKDKVFKKQIRKLDYEERCALVDRLSNTPYFSSTSNLDLLAAKEFDNILQYTCTVKEQLGAFMPVLYLKQILMCNTVEAGVKELSKIANQEYIIKEQLAKSIQRVHNSRGPHDVTSEFVRKLNFGLDKVIENVDARINGETDKPTVSVNDIFDDSKWRDPLLGVDTTLIKESDIVEGGKDLNFVDNVYSDTPEEEPAPVKEPVKKSSKKSVSKGE